MLVVSRDLRPEAELLAREGVMVKNSVGYNLQQELGFEAYYATCGGGARGLKPYVKTMDIAPEPLTLPSSATTPST